MFLIATNLIFLPQIFLRRKRCPLISSSPLSQRNKFAEINDYFNWFAELIATSENESFITFLLLFISFWVLIAVFLSMTPFAGVLIELAFSGRPMHKLKEICVTEHTTPISN